MAWMTTGFVRDALPAFGFVLESAACCLFGCQVCAIAVSVRLLRHTPIVVAACVSAIVATMGEILQAQFGVAWPVMSLSVPAAATPVAQLAAGVTPFGIAWILYFVNFLFVRDNASQGWLRSAGPIAGIGVASLALVVGQWIGTTTAVEPMRFTTMLVQPSVAASQESTARLSTALDELTQKSRLAGGPVDLVVWPETCLSVSSWPEPGQPLVVDQTASDLTLQRFFRDAQPRYDTACLVGVPLWRREVASRYGLELPEVRLYNTACLIPRSGAMSFHQKLALVPLKEGLPDWLNQPWVRRRVLPIFGMHAQFTQGDRFRLLSFTTRSEQLISVAVSICYESHMPALPQFRDSRDVDAIVHLTCDTDFLKHPEWMERHILACRYRAIETRRWNLVCSTSSGSAIIDPVGRVIARLNKGAGVLRNDEVTSRRENQ